VKPSAWVWIVCAVLLLIAASLAFSGALYPAVIVLILVTAVLIGYRVR
jgi:mannose/fructose/N-acetylgalactosamine-specific phosphotransferase system component IID